MSDYLQPPFYRFNEDSLKLVQFVSSRIKEAHSLLDLGAGSGVIGLELCQKINVRDVEFVELQSEFIPFLEKNIQDLLPQQIYSKIHLTSFKNFNPERKFEVIVSNPPYYLPGHGQPSLNEKRDLARTFKQDSWRELFFCCERSLAQNGHGFIVVKNNPIIRKEILASQTSSLDLKIHEQDDLFILELVLIEHKEK